MEENTNKKILVLSPFYPPHVGGLQSHADEFNRELAKRGYIVTVLTPRLPILAKRAERKHGNVMIHRYPAWEVINHYPLPKFWQLSWWRIWREIRSDHYDLVISRTRFFYTSLLAWRLARLRKLPWLHIEHGANFVQARFILVRWLSRLYDETLGRLVLRAADAVVANSEGSAGFVKQLAPQQDIFVIHRGVEKDKIVEIEMNKNLRGKYGDRVIITFVGRLIDGKGLIDLMKAIYRLREESIHCLIIGDGPERRKLNNLTKRLGIGGLVSFLGEKDFVDVIAILKASDIFVNPSYTEGLPTAVIEAALCGKAIVATQVGGTPEIITDGVSGVLIPPRRIDLLYKKIGILVADEVLRAKLGREAKKEAAGKFDWKVSIERYEQVFRELLKEKAA